MKMKQVTDTATLLEDRGSRPPDSPRFNFSPRHGGTEITNITDIGESVSQKYQAPEKRVQASALRAAAGWLFFRPAAADSLDPYESRYGHFTASPARTALKNSQLTRRPPGDVTIISETVH